MAPVGPSTSEQPEKPLWPGRARTVGCPSSRGPTLQSRARWAASTYIHRALSSNDTICHGRKWVGNQAHAQTTTTHHLCPESANPKGAGIGATQPGGPPRDRASMQHWGQQMQPTTRWREACTITWGKGERVARNWPTHAAIARRAFFCIILLNLVEFGFGGLSLGVCVVLSVVGLAVARLASH